MVVVEVSSKRITCEISGARPGCGECGACCVVALGPQRDVGPRWVSKKGACDEQSCSPRASRFWRTYDTRYCGHRSRHALHLVIDGRVPLDLGEPHTGRGKPPPPTVPRPRPTRAEQPRRVDHATNQQWPAAHRSAGPEAPAATQPHTVPRHRTNLPPPRLSSPQHTTESRQEEQ